jgi:hypothetical protein
MKGKFDHSIANVQGNAFKSADIAPFTYRHPIPSDNFSEGLRDRLAISSLNRHIRHHFLEFFNFKVCDASMTKP